MQKIIANQSGEAFVPTAGDLSAKGAEQFEADCRARGKRVTREQFMAEWMGQAIQLRAWTWFDVRTSATLEALYGRRARA